MGDKLKFFCKTVVFLLLLALILVPVQRVMARKSLSGTWDMTNKVAGFYNEEEDQFEVMFFGPSHAYAAFSPLVIWEETGIKSYVFSTQQQPLWATYTYIKEALKTQSPALIVLECRMALGDKEYYMEEGDDKAVTYPYMDDLPLSWNKVELAVQSAPEPEERFGLLFNFMMYHSRWNDLHREDFAFRRDEARDPYKGFVMLEPQEPLQPRPASETVTQAVPLLEKNQYWLEEIIKLCQEEGIELWLIKSPSNLELEEKALLNTVEETARRYNVPFHDFNVDYADIGLDESMFFDAHHMDALGAGKFSRYFAHILQSARPNLKTDSGDPVWAADLEVYQRALEGM
ncbi:MAG: hypothetical protein HFF47_00700 [Lawsonibacter sp.]|jgi:hypothetical protein|nr:hypothetical protein [Lawsonibacter sp.]